MAKEIRLPQLGQTMEEGTIVTILVKEGDKISRGDVIFEVETDKATLEMESPADGFVKKLLIEENQTIPVNDAMLIVGDEGEEVTQSFIDSVMPAGSAPAASPVEQAPAAAPETATPAPAAAPAASGAVECPAAKVVRLPQLGQTMEEGTIVTIMIKPGDEISRGDVIFEVETDKATLEMESPADGFVKNVLVEDGQTIPVNDPLVILAGKDDEVPAGFVDSLKGAPAAAPVAQQPAAAPAATQVVVTEAEPTQKVAGKIFASPRAKLFAKQNGVDLATVSPKPGAIRIVEADVKAAMTSAVSQAATIETKYQLGQKIPVSKMQKIVGERMLASKQEIPCFYLSTNADVTKMVKLREKLNRSGDVKIAFNDFIIRAIAMGLQHYPSMTGQLAGDHIQLASTINIGLAIAVADGLVAPLVRDAQNKNLAQTAQYSKALIGRAKSGKLGPDDLSGGCITVSNLGAFGIDSFIPIVVPGQCSIIGVGRIAETCVPSHGNILVKKMMNMTISVDHKVANGADAAQFLDFIRKQLEDPETLV